MSRFICWLVGHCWSVEYYASRKFGYYTTRKCYRCKLHKQNIKNKTILFKTDKQWLSQYKKIFNLK